MVRVSGAVWDRSVKHEGEHPKTEGSGLGVELPSLEHEGFSKGSQFDPGRPQS